jgi:hypothetical protein
MIPVDKEVWQIAASILSHQRKNSVAYAERRAKEALDKDDVLGHAIWLAVKQAVVELTRQREEGEPVQ